MLDEMQALSLLGLLACQWVLIRGCFRINESIPVAGDSITEKIDRTADLIDEVAQLISDFSDNVTPPAVAQPPSGLGEMVANLFLTKMQNTSEHAPQSEEWEVQFKNDDPTPTHEA